MTAPFVMLVDDEVPFVETMAKRLATRNIEIITAFSAEEGLEKLKTIKTSMSLSWMSRCRAWMGWRC